jgi:AhpD family alkylhydroperoxidase
LRRETEDSKKKPVNLHTQILFTADLMISFDLLEALRYSHYLKKEGRLVVNNHLVLPTSVYTQKLVAPTDDEIITALKKHTLCLLDADKMATDAGSPLSQNVVMLGSMPFILPVLRERPEYFALSSLADERVCRPKHLSPKIAELMALATAAGAGAEFCMKLHIRAAIKEGASRDEIYDTILIAALVGKTRVLAYALRELCEEYPLDTKDRQLPR